MPNPPPLQPGHVYHLYNRGNNGEDLFREERNYAYFLKLYAAHILPVADTFVYCLMPNHFHLMVRIKSDDAKKRSRGSPASERQPLERSIGQTSTASQAFAVLFNTYAQAINKAHQRTGSLFEHPFHRKIIQTESYFLQLIPYIHRNPQTHGFVKDFRDWPHSSYHTLLGTRATKLRSNEALGWFGSKEKFIEAHQNELHKSWLLDQDFD